MNDIKSPIFCVFHDPYCLWDQDYIERNKEFVAGIDVEHFEFILNKFIDDEDEMRSSIIIKTTLHHAVETMFTLMGAYVQAPDVAYAWVTKCPTGHLRNLLKAMIEGNNNIPRRNSLIKNLTFEDISQAIHQYSVYPNREKDNTIKLYSVFWLRMARDFLDSNSIDEYNSLKHGFRVKSGGSKIKIAVEKEQNVRPPDSEFKTLCDSQFGTRFFKVEKTPDIHGNRSIRTKRTSLNWSIERTILLLQLVSMSINNIVNSLKNANGAKPSESSYLRPENDSDFELPWTYSTNVTSMNLDLQLPENLVQKTSKSELLEIISNHPKNS